MTELELKDKVVVIVDASNELGQACASLFAAQGTRLVVNYPPNARASLHALEKNKGCVAVTHEHVYDSDKVVETALSRFNSIHVLINNATLQNVDSDAFESDYAWDSMRSAVMKGAFKVSKHDTPPLSPGADMSRL